MANSSMINVCPPPFWDSNLFSADGGYVAGRLCEDITDDLACCLPCPMYEWFFPDSYRTISITAAWVATVSEICTAFLLVTWAVLPVEKTSRHYLSICLALSVLIMNLGFIIPLAGRAPQCYDKITPHDMHTSSICGASGALLLGGGFAGVMWAFLRSVSLHLQICWQVLVSRNFMIFAQLAGWGIPIIGITLALVFSGVSIRFGQTCLINHDNSLADYWIPLLIFAGLTVIITFATFGYCIKVYLAALGDHSASTQGSGLPAPHAAGGKALSPRQTYRRIRRVITLQWRGIAIVLIIIADVIFFSVVLVWQDNTTDSVVHNPNVAEKWVLCLIGAGGDKSQCYDEAKPLITNEATIGAVLLLLALNGIWLLFLLGRWSMVTGWYDLLSKPFNKERKKEFVSVDAHYENSKGLRTYEMLSRGSSTVASPMQSVQSPSAIVKRESETSEYFGPAARYHAPARSFSSPKPPQSLSWNAADTYAPPRAPSRNQEPEQFRESDEWNPLGMNRV